MFNQWNDPSKAFPGPLILLSWELWIADPYIVIHLEGNWINSWWITNIFLHMYDKSGIAHNIDNCTLFTATISLNCEKLVWYICMWRRHSCKDIVTPSCYACQGNPKPVIAICHAPHSNMPECETGELYEIINEVVRSIAHSSSNPASTST